MPPRAGAIRAGRAYVELFADNSALVRDLRAAEYKIKAFGANVRNMGVRMLAAAGAMAAPFALTIKNAGDAIETLNKFDQVFGTLAPKAGKFADTLAQAVGRSKYEIRDSLASFHAFFLGFGFGEEQSRQLAQSMEGLALDFASLYNIKDALAMEKFQSGLAGMPRTLRAYGINLLDSTAAAKAYAMGIAKAGEELSGQQKVLARVAILMETMTKQGVVGDAIRTAGQFINRCKALRGALYDMSVDIGLTIIPEVTKFVDKAVRTAYALGTWMKTQKELIKSSAGLVLKIAAIGAALVVIGTSVRAIGFVVGGLARLLKVIKLVRLAVIGLGKALSALMAHPVVAVLALGAAVVALSYALARLQIHVAKLRNEMEGLAATHAYERAVDRERIRLLAELAKKTRLTTREQKFAVTTLAILKRRYGDLGAEIDKVTGKLIRMEEAQKRANARMRSFEIADVEAQMAEAQHNLLQTTREIETTSTAKHSILRGLFGVGPGITGEEKLERLNDLERQREAYAKRLLALHQRLAGLKVGEPSEELDLTGLLNLMPGEDEAKRLGDWGRRVLQARAGMIKDEYERELKLARIKWMEEYREANEAGHDITALKAAQTAERIALDAKYWDKKMAAGIALLEELDQEARDIEIDLIPDQTQRELAGLLQDIKEIDREARGMGMDIEARKELLGPWVKARIEQIKAGAAVAADTSAVGTFSAAAAWGMGIGPGTGIDRVAKATEETSKNTADMKTALEEALTHS